MFEEHPIPVLITCASKSTSGKLPRQLEIVLLSDVCNRNRGLRRSAIDRTSDSDLLPINLPRPNNALSFYLKKKGIWYAENKLYSFGSDQVS